MAFTFTLPSYDCCIGFDAKEVLRHRDVEDVGWREDWQRVERCERTGVIEYVEVFFGPLRFAAMRGGGREAKRLFGWRGYSMSVGWAWLGERCFRLCREAGLDLLFLGLVVVCIEYPDPEQAAAEVDA